ncbi:MAG: hypothetical protein MUP41_19960 [Desulfobacterales bacterium]|nr:hypothetical protein [Desulfobacterales bacterium]
MPPWKISVQIYADAAVNPWKVHNDAWTRDFEKPPSRMITSLPSSRRVLRDIIMVIARSMITQ